MKRIKSDPNPRMPVTSDQLIRLAQFLSRRFYVDCGVCRERLQLTVEGGEMRLGSSPDLAALDPAQFSRPRILLHCSRCKRMFGYIQGDEWVLEPEDNPATRWNHLELEDK